MDCPCITPFDKSLLLGFTECSWILCLFVVGAFIPTSPLWIGHTVCSDRLLLFISVSFTSTLSFKLGHNACSEDLFLRIGGTFIWPFSLSANTLRAPKDCCCPKSSAILFRMLSFMPSHKMYSDPAPSIDIDVCFSALMIDGAVSQSAFLQIPGNAAGAQPKKRKIRPACWLLRWHTHAGESLDHPFLSRADWQHAHSTHLLHHHACAGQGAGVRTSKDVTRNWGISISVTFWFSTRYSKLLHYHHIFMEQGVSRRKERMAPQGKRIEMHRNGHPCLEIIVSFFMNYILIPLLHPLRLHIGSILLRRKSNHFPESIHEYKSPVYTCMIILSCRDSIWTPFSHAFVHHTPYAYTNDH